MVTFGLRDVYTAETTGEGGQEVRKGGEGRGGEGREKKKKDDRPRCWRKNDRGVKEARQGVRVGRRWKWEAEKQG